MFVAAIVFNMLILEIFESICLCLHLKFTFGLHNEMLQLKKLYNLPSDVRQLDKYFC